MKPFSFVIVILLGFACASNAFAQFPTATPEHEILKKEEGKWTASVSLFYGPAGELNPPEKSTATEVNKMIGPFWLTSEFSGSFGGQPFTGQGQFGYDAKQKKYVGTWIDSFNAYPSKMLGTYDADSKTMTYETTGVGFGDNPMVGKNVVVYESDDKRIMTMYTKVPDGDEMVKVMEAVYSRVKSEK